VAPAKRWNDINAIGSAPKFRRRNRLAARHVTQPGVAAVRRRQSSRYDSGRAEAREWVSLTDGNLRLIVRADRPDSAEFYDWSRDPREAENRAAENPPQLQPMLERIDRYRRDSEPPWGVESPTIEIDELRLNQLRALGYRVGS